MDASRYEIAVENPSGVTRGIASIEFDGISRDVADGRVPLTSDGATHRVRVVLG